MTSFDFDPLFKDTVSKYSHVLQSWGLEFRHIHFGGHHITGPWTLQLARGGRGCGLRPSGLYPGHLPGHSRAYRCTVPRLRMALCGDSRSFPALGDSWVSRRCWPLLALRGH